jgi:uncharacterized membrane protein YcaP (DUF421 family)
MMLDNIFIKTAFELTVGFIGLVISVRIIGRRQIQQITPFDFISAIVLGEILGNVLYDDDTKWYVMLFSIGVWTILSFTIETINVKSVKSRSLIEGRPTMVIRNGKIQFDVMKKEKLDFGELMSLLRQKDVFAIREVEYAFIETSGAISVMKKDAYLQPNKSDLKLNLSKQNINLAVIQDGEMMEHNLNELKLTKAWVNKKLKDNHIHSIKDILYAEWDNKQFYYQKYDTKDKKN